MKDNSAEDLGQKIAQIIRNEQPETVAQLVSVVKQKLSISEEQITEVILKMQKEGKISFKKQPLPAPLRLSAYVMTGQTLWYWLTLTLATATTVVVFAVPEGLYPWVYARNVLGAVFVLWLPGYAFIKALFPAEPPVHFSQKNLDTIERIALSLGMSLALVPIIGLLLNYTPWGIRLEPVTLSLLAFTLIMATAALIREHQVQSKSKS